MLGSLAKEYCEFLWQNRGTFSLHSKNLNYCGFESRAMIARERYNMINVSENMAALNQHGIIPAVALVKLWSESKSH